MCFCAGIVKSALKGIHSIGRQNIVFWGWINMNDEKHFYVCHLEVRWVWEWFKTKTCYLLTFPSLIIFTWFLLHAWCNIGSAISTLFMHLNINFYNVYECQKVVSSLEANTEKRMKDSMETWHRERERERVSEWERSKRMYKKNPTDF